MEKMNEIRKHLKAVNQTRQITNAMFLLSTSRMKKAMSKVDFNREYFNRVRSTVKDILTKSQFQAIEHPYLTKRPAKRAAYLIVSGDKGMCGAYIHNIMDFAFDQLKQADNPYVISIGLMTSDYLNRKKMNVDEDWLGVAQNPSMYNARRLTEDLCDLYEDGKVDEVYIIYTRFINSSVQYPRCVRLLPLAIEDYTDVTLEYEYDAEMIYEPSPQAVFNRLVPQYSCGLVFGALVQSYASENCARMNAMQNATRNADEMIKKLKIRYNTARQVAITQEITEISAAAKYQNEQ